MFDKWMFVAILGDRRPFWVFGSQTLLGPEDPDPSLDTSERF